MPKYIDMTGKKFGNWTALKYAGTSKWLCRCDCGRTATVVGATLRNGTSTKCRSCATAETNRKTKVNNKNTVSHGKSKTRLYRIWGGIISRCENPNDTGFKNYGGRGIHICTNWRQDFLTFEEWALANGYSDSLSIDRIDCNKDYCPENCRWATAEVQANNVRSNHNITFRGETLTLALLQYYHQEAPCQPGRVF